MTIKTNKYIYALFLEWFVAPRTNRGFDEKDLSAFAKKYGVTRQTLYYWMKRPYFVKKIEELNKSNKEIKLQDVRNAIYEGAVIKRDVAAQKLFLQYEDGWSEKAQVEHSGKIELNADAIREAIEKAKK